jgi:1-acyl-sn-glycerol-3-phosphate acyltransferase
MIPPAPSATTAGGGAPKHARTNTLVPIEGGLYSTPPRPIGWLARMFPSAMFYAKFARIVWRAAALAKRGRYSGDQWSKSSVAVLRALESVGVEFEFTGVEHLQQVDGPCVIVGNHMSTLETAVLPGVIQPIREVTFVVKKSLVDYPVFKHVMRSRNPIAVSQTNPREDLKTTLVEGAERLQSGASIVVFPEGSRMKTFDPQRFNTIGVKLAGRSGVPIVPLALKTDAWPVGKWISDAGRIDPTKKVRMAFGQPLRVDGRGADQQQAIIDFIQTRLDAWAADEARAARSPLTLTTRLGIIVP